MSKAKIMKTLLCLCMLLIPLGMSAQGKKVNINVKDASLSSALRQVEQQSGYYKINYPSAEVSRYKVTANVKNATAPQAVNELLQGLPFTSSVNGQFIQIKRSARAASNGPQKAIRGRLLDADGEPLIGATVKVKDSNVGTVTDQDGYFLLPDASSNDVLQFSYVGKKTMQRQASSKNMTIILEDDGTTIDDVIVTGYQTISKERSAGSYDIIKGDEVSKKFLTANSVIDGLDGLATGLAISRNKYQDKYLIRGTTSINSERAPLFVVDGVPMESSVVEEMVNSNDIANITVLKDATAASIWGSQAANGVIVITTKKGSNNSRVKVSYSGSITTYGMPDYDYYNYMDGATFMKNAQEMFDAYSDVFSYNTVKMSTSGTSANACYHSQTPVIWPHERLMYQYKNGEITKEQRDAGLAQLLTNDGRAQFEDTFMSNKYFTQHNVNVSGGNDKTKYYLSLGYKGDQGSYKDWSNRININAYQEYQIAKWLKWDVTLNATFSNKHAHLNPYSEYRNSGMGERWFDEDAYNEFASAIEDFMYTNLPYHVLRDANGWVDQSPYVMSQEQRDAAEATTGVDLSFYPVNDFYKSVNSTNSTNLRVNTGLTVNLFKGMRYEGRFQYSRINRKVETYRPQDTYYVRFEKTVMFNPSTNKFRTPETGGNFGVNNSVATDWTLRNQFVYDNSFGNGDHQVTGLLGTEVRSYKYTSFNNSIRGYDMQTMKAVDYDLYALSGGFTMPVVIGWYASVNSRVYSQSETAKKYFSLYANAAYTYLNKYTINASMRMDQSNLFGSDPSNQYKPIWAVGAAWKISEESFMKDINWINELKLRASFGFAGNSPQPGTGGKYDILYATNDSRYPGPGYQIETPANKKLTWEKTRTINLGFDLRTLNNRLDISFDYYDKYTTDLIGTLMLNPTTGWLSTTGNLGEMSNRGLELTVNSHNIKSRDFNWHTMLTLSYNKNKIEKLEVKEARTLASDMIIGGHIEGYPMGSMFSYRYAGLDADGYPQVYDKNGEIVTKGNISYLDTEDAVYSGTSIPKVTGGLSNTFTYKDFALSFMFSYSLGNKLRKDADIYYGRVGSGLKKILDERWRKPGDEQFTDVPVYLPQSNSNYNTSAYYYADTHILDASYIKLRDVTLSYTIPSSWAQKIHASSIVLTGQIGNLLTIAFNGEGIDPEYYALSSPGYTARFTKYGPSYSFGISVNF